MKKFARMTVTKLVKNPNTKTTYIVESRNTEEIDETTYNNIVTSSPFFRRLGGKEHHVKSYTSRGYKTIQLTSVSPDKQNKTVRTFKIH